MALGSDGMIADGLATLEWLKEMQTAPAGHFRAVGTASFGRTMRKPMPFDQQPLEAAAMIDAASAARKSVVKGKSVSGRVNLGGRRCLKTKITDTTQHPRMKSYNPL